MMTATCADAECRRPESFLTREREDLVTVLCCGLISGTPPEEPAVHLIIHWRLVRWAKGKKKGSGQPAPNRSKQARMAGE